MKNRTGALHPRENSSRQRGPAPYRHPAGNCRPRARGTTALMLVIDLFTLRMPVAQGVLGFEVFVDRLGFRFRMHR